MHIPDGVLSLPVVVAGAGATAAALGMTLRRIDDSALSKVAIVSAMFFVVSLINVPVGPTSVHLVLSGLMGMVLGWATVPAVFIGLVLQAVFFGFGGITTLGVTTMNIALPGVLWALALQPRIAGATTPLRKGLWGGLVAVLAIATSGAMVAGVLALSDPAYLGAAPFVLLTYVPLAVGEAIVTGCAVAFLARVKPDMLGIPIAAHRPGEAV